MMKLTRDIKSLLRISCVVLCLVPVFGFVVVVPQKCRGERRQRSSLRPMAAADDKEPDLFDYFDPLLSPHAYPDGIAPDHKPKTDKITEDDREKPTRLHKRSVQTVQDPTQVFDPTLSPHAYPDGTPSAIIGDKVASRKRVGILLVDHGSKKQASNERLQELARIYQQSVESNVVVKAAHMEIAEPSIPKQLESLLNEGVDEIVVHPYFLSPSGRHVSDDIPEILNGAIESLSIDVPVITTEPVGADMSRMMQVVQSICEESSQVLGKNG